VYNNTRPQTNEERVCRVRSGDDDPTIPRTSVRHYYHHRHHIIIMLSASSRYPPIPTTHLQTLLAPRDIGKRIIGDRMAGHQQRSKWTMSESVL